MILIVIITGIIAIWSIMYTHNVKKKGINNIISNIKEYEKKKVKQQKSKV